MPDSALIGGLTNLFCAAICAALAIPMLRERPHRHVTSSRVQAFMQAVQAVTREGGRTLLRAAGLVALIGIAAFFLPYGRVPGLLPIVTFAPAIILGLACSRIAARMRALKDR